ncbi:uncharacterized protein RJT20DRAFT_59291 [Scheffersomyces xylosifermentans]|uniref:uncharacterized protein n=1 Tax=Scheffersomyces xylosifermentans TaxID=1304137 RepID=UPI00315C8F03
MGIFGFTIKREKKSSSPELPELGGSIAPSVPKGWEASFDKKHNAWFYTNLNMKKSQWEPPTGTTFETAPIESDADELPPPEYAEEEIYSEGASSRQQSNRRGSSYNTYNTHQGSPMNDWATTFASTMLAAAASAAQNTSGQGNGSVFVADSVTYTYSTTSSRRDEKKGRRTKSRKSW